MIPWLLDDTKVYRRPIEIQFQTHHTTRNNSVTAFSLEGNARQNANSVFINRSEFQFWRKSDNIIGKLELKVVHLYNYVYNFTININVTIIFIYNLREFFTAS